jgi:hypothetical protein
MITNTTLKVNDIIVLPEPTTDDNWNIGGAIVHVRKIQNDMVIVMDNDGDCFSIEIDRAINNKLEDVA